jgi:hypothetical protein
MPDGPEKKVTKEDVEKLNDSVVAELKALVKKLPYWKSVLIGVALVGALVAAVAACAAIAGATGPAFAIALAGCVGAILSALAAIITFIADWVDESGESREIKLKEATLEKYKEQLKQQG